MTIRPIPRLSVLAWGSAAALALTVVAACGSDSSPVPGAPRPQASGSSAATGLPSVLVQRVDSAYAKAGRPEGEVPELDTENDCPLGVQIRIAGHDAEPFGAGVSTIGRSGHRVVCQGSHPSSTLSVGHLGDASELEELRSGSGPQDEAGNDQTGSTETVGSRTFTVVRTTYPSNDSHIDYTVTLTDPAQLAYAVLQVETTGEARQTYDPAQAAQDLSSILDSAA